MNVSLLSNNAYIWGKPLGHCRFKHVFSDFQVEEILPFEPEDQGEHCYLYLQKTGQNTDWVAGQLARYAGVKRSEVSYAGKKDRHAITQQWFSIRLPGKETPEWKNLDIEGVSVLQQTRHRKKLKNGVLQANNFIITLRDVEADRLEVDQRLARIRQNGVPNYFGSQRFGHNGHNIEKARQMFENHVRMPRNKRAMYLSATRSWLFNQVVAERIKQGIWDNPVAGDVFGFHDNHSIIRDAVVDETIKARVRAGEISPTGPLWGEGALLSTQVCHDLEQQIIARFPDLSKGLVSAGLHQERRVIRLIPDVLDWQWPTEHQLCISMRLPKGCFATSVLREILICDEPACVSHEQALPASC
ncbi:tRNA pseudouridine synthase D [invertebrate metagenome]|uniref:tRNA pseudouridine synthase D n=1 Tax=invertebrate metagenome TaxID=1711999 RepID=A0A2H9T9A7_9ZZZZ